MSKTATILSEIIVIDIEEVITHDVSIVTIIANVQHDQFVEFHGVAKRHPEDKHNTDTARLLATARAYRSMADSLDRRANGLVAHNDSVREHKSGISENRAKHQRRRDYWQQKILGR